MFLLSVLFIILLISIIKINAQNTPPMPNIPIVGGLVQNESSLPDTFEKFQATADALSEEESRKAYLKQEWTKILAENKAMAPILYYTDKFFSYLDPLWNFVFQQSFSWSWIFILSFSLFLTFLYIFYVTAAPFTQAVQSDKLINSVISFCLTCLIGISGGISAIIAALVIPIKNIWMIVILIFIIICIVIIYRGLMKSIKKGMKEKIKKGREEETGLRQKQITQFGKGLEKGLKE